MPPIPFRMVLANGRRRGGQIPSVALAIVNPVAGTSGIYQVTDDDGNTFPAYVDMATDGGYWILACRWATTTNTAAFRTFNQLVVRGQPISGYSNSTASFPAIPSGRIAANPATEYHMRSTNTAWVSAFGTWQRMSTFANSSDTIVHGTGVPAVTSIGARTMHGHRTGWSQNTDMTWPIGFWTVAGNGGLCGGASRVGTNKCCPVNSNGDGGSHYDATTSVKQVFLRATNYPG